MSATEVDKFEDVAEPEQVDTAPPAPFSTTPSSTAVAAGELPPPAPSNSSSPPLAASTAEPPSPPEFHTIQSILDAGVPADSASAVLELSLELGIHREQTEPLADPLTLYRFQVAREDDPDGTPGGMHRAAVAWRGPDGVNVPSLMGQYGRNYEPLPTRQAPTWAFVREPTTALATKVEKHFFASILSSYSEADEPIALWRFGAVDMYGINRAKLFDNIVEAYTCHLEQILQLGRQQSFKKGSLVKARIIIDSEGITLSKLTYIGMINRIVKVGRETFPELTCSITIINAPWVFEKFFVLISPVLAPSQRRKVCILGKDYDEGLLKHAGVKRAMLPKCMGGEADDGQAAKCDAVEFN